MVRVVFGAAQPVEILDGDVKLAVTAVSGVVLGAKSVGFHLRRIRIAVLASRVKGVADGPGFVDDLQSSVMRMD